MMSVFSQNRAHDRKRSMTITKLGRYDIVRVLGKGAMGMVYEARDPNLDRRVAIKTIKVENLSAEASADYEARFRTEARSAARLQHPNIVSVYDSERHGDTAYLVMEYVQGDDLKQHLDGGKRYSVEQSVSIVRDLLAALDYAHRQNIVHRDVKPANLLVEASGRVKLTDFGVARIQDSGEATRTKGSMVGTLKYMSPEQVQGLSVDARADLFAAGIVLYQLLTGKRPFDGESEFAIIHQIVSQHPALPSSINPQLPAALDAVVERALAKQREDRFASAQEFALALQEASGQVPDPTIVPPFSAADQRGGSGTGSGALRSRGGSMSGTARSGESSGATVTQELELVYWKDIKDTDDASDLRGFLDRFPEGIYADLARRRLKKLEASERGEQSSATRTAIAPVQAPPAADDATAVTGHYSDATLVTPRTGNVPVTDSAGDAPAPDAGAAVPVADDTTHTQAVAAVAPPAETRAPRMPDAVPTTDPVTEPARSGGPKLVLGLAVLLAGAGLAYMFSSGGASAPAEPAPSASAASAPLPVADMPAQAASVATLPAVEAAVSAAVATRTPAKAASGAGAGNVSRPAVAAKSAAVSAAAASASANPATPASPTPAPAPAAAGTVTRPASPKPPVAEPKPVAQPATGPAQACEGRVLFAYQACLSEQCAKPAFASLPMCVERSANERNQRARQGADNR
jgi:eukaryotic-like serine/threonine-protein kinase